MKSFHENLYTKCSLLGMLYFLELLLEQKAEVYLEKMSAFSLKKRFLKIYDKYL